MGWEAKRTQVTETQVSARGGAGWRGASSSRPGCQPSTNGPQLRTGGQPNANQRAPSHTKSGPARHTRPGSACKAPAGPHPQFCRGQHSGSNGQELLRGPGDSQRYTLQCRFWSPSANAQTAPSGRQSPLRASAGLTLGHAHPLGSTSRLVLSVFMWAAGLAGQGSAAIGAVLAPSEPTFCLGASKSSNSGCGVGSHCVWQDRH